MKRPTKSKVVSWANGRKLCQIIYFSSDDSPSQIGRQSQGRDHHLQEKSTSILCSSTNESNDSDLPPGFENGPFLNQSMVKWECPPQFAISPRWFVAAGEASKEKYTQNLRELRVLEAHYPRPSNIPPSPLDYLEVKEEEYDDTDTPVVTLIPIEESEDYDGNASPDLVPLIPMEVQEEVPMDMSPERTVANAPSDLQSQNLQQQYLSATTAPLSAGCNSSSSIVSSDVGAVGLTPLSWVSQQDLAAVAALLEAISKMLTQHGGLINVDLLIKVFNNPQMVERLCTESRIPPTNSSASSSNNPQSISTFGLNPAFPIPPMPLSATSSPGVAAAYSGTPLTGAASLLPSSLVKPSAPSFTVLNLAPIKLETQFPDAISSYSMANSTHDHHQPATAAPAPLSWPVCAPFTTASEIQFPWPSYTPFEHAPQISTVDSENIHKPNGVPAAALNIPPQRDTVLATSSSSSGMKRAASFSISSNEQSPVHFSSTSEKYLNAFGTQTTSRRTTTLHASQSNKDSSSASAAPWEDVEFYKNLVRQRDEAKRVKKESEIGTSRDSRSSSRELKPAAQDTRHQEPVRHRSDQRHACIYYNSPRGCRNGDKCRFRHDGSGRREADNRGSSYLKKLRL